MKRYVEQLLEDIAELSAKEMLKICTMANMEVEADLDFDPDKIENFMNGKDLLENIIHIPQETLPLPEKLTETQRALLAKALKEYLGLFNFYLDFPPALPHHFYYKHIRKILKDEHIYTRYWGTYIEFCDYIETNCPFPGYCDLCKNAW